MNDNGKSAITSSPIWGQQHGERSNSNFEVIHRTLRDVTKRREELKTRSKRENLYDQKTCRRKNDMVVVAKGMPEWIEG